jgi:protein TonB
MSTPAAPGPGFPSHDGAGDRKRRHLRTKFASRPVPVEIGFGGKAFGLDISESGLGIESFVVLQSGEVRRVRFTMPEGSSFQALGRVVWTDASHRAGIQFLNVPDAYRDELKRWLARQPATPATVPAPELSAPPERVRSASPAPNRGAQDLDVASALELAVERAHEVARASGAALALGDAANMICCASCGVAPEIGVRLNPERGLSGQCIATRQVVYCADTENDARVDPVVSRQLGMRSALLIPIFAHGVLHGILELFSPAPNAFDAHCIERLKRIAELISSISPEAAAAPAAAAEPAAVLPSTVATPSADAAGAGAASLVANERGAGTSARVSSAEETEICDVCGNVNGPTATVCERCDVPLRKAIAATAACSPVPLAARALQTAEPVDAAESTPEEPVAVEQPAIQPALKPRAAAPITSMKSALLVLLVLAAAVLALRAWRQRLPRAVAASSAPAVVQQPAPVPAPITPPVAAPIMTPAMAPAAMPAPAPRQLTPPASAIAGQRRAVARPAAVADAAPPTETRAVDAVPANPGLRPPPASPPQLAPPAAEKKPEAAALTSRPPEFSNAPRRIAVSQGVAEGLLISKVVPRYPAIARGARVEGVVTLGATIGKAGTLENVRVVNGHPLLVSSAVEAVKQWRYTPYKLNGQPVPAETTIVVKFRLNDSR